MPITFTTSLLSWKKITATIGMTGRPKTLMALENKEDTSKINPIVPTTKICEAIAVSITVMAQENFPSPNSSTSLHKPFHSPLMKSPTRAAEVAIIDWYIIISNTFVCVSPFGSLLKKSCVRESINPYPDDALMVHMNPIAYVPENRVKQQLQS
ncbi:hypothetical protein SLA2020_247640 [Shorea laevis]